MGGLYHAPKKIIRNHPIPYPHREKMADTADKMTAPDGISNKFPAHTPYIVKMQTEPLSIPAHEPYVEKYTQAKTKRRRTRQQPSNTILVDENNY